MPDLEPQVLIETQNLEALLGPEFRRFCYPVRLTDDPNGGFWAECPDLPGCGAPGETLAETLQNLHESREFYLEVRSDV